MSEIRLVNGKPLLRAGKLATADACCEQCDCDMGALVASGKTVTATATFNIPAGVPCPPPPQPQQLCQCPQGAYTLTANLAYGATGPAPPLPSWYGVWQDVTVGGVTCSILIELYCVNCEWVLKACFYTFEAFAATHTYNCGLYSPPNLNPNGLNEFVVGLCTDLYPLESKTVDGVCVPKDLDVDFEWDGLGEAGITGTLSLSIT